MPIPIITQTTSRQDFIPFIKALIVVKYLRGNIEIPPGLREGTCSKRFGDQRLIFPIQCQVLVHSRWVEFIFAQLDNGSKVWLGRGEVSPQISAAPETTYRSRARSKTRGGKHPDNTKIRETTQTTTTRQLATVNFELIEGEDLGGPEIPLHSPIRSLEPHGELKSQADRYLMSSAGNALTTSTSKPK